MTGSAAPGSVPLRVSGRDGILKVSNAALRYKPTGEKAEALAQGAGAMRGGGAGIAEDLARTATALELTPPQQQAFDAAAQAISARQAARQAAPAAPAATNRVFGGGPGGGGQRSAPAGGNVPAQMRQRMIERYQQDFAAFRGSLQPAQRQAWDAAIAAQIGATRAPLFRLVEGVPQQVMVRIGASDGTSTEVSGALEAGDEAVTGERAAP